MSRRAPKSELAFGSDSFLDVVCNVVGILIILMVIAGVRVSKTPVTLKPQPPPAPAEAPVAALVPEPAMMIEPEPAPGAPPPSAEADNQHDELLSRIQSVEEDTAALDQQMASHAAELRRMAEQTASLRDRRDASSASLISSRHTAQLTRNEIAQQLAEVRRRRDELRNLDAKLDAPQQDSTQVETLRHEMTPVSQVVTGDEIHFRLAGERVSVVPIQGLLERVRARIERQKEWLFKFNRHQGEIGPIDGYTMNYTIERKALTLVEELRTGRGLVSIVMSQFAIEPTEDLETESAEEALTPGSRFQQLLQGSDRDTAITFWVYPDSFKLFRTLQTEAHRKGFTVSGRPLPFGVPITGSPHGSSSAAQ